MPRPALFCGHGGSVRQGREVALAGDASFIDVDAHVGRNLTNFTDDVHFTMAGAELVAMSVAEEVIESGMVERRRRF